MAYRTPLARARGLGSAHSGTEHFIQQRLTGVALVPLTIWFVFALAYLANSDYAQAVAWFQNPLHAVLFISFLLANVWHANLGLQVIIEDYIHSEGWKIIALMLLKGSMALSAIAGVYFIMRVTLNGQLFIGAA